MFKENYFSSIKNIFRVKVREGRIGEITEILAWYEYINDVILDHLDDEIKSTDRSGVWRYLISFKVRCDYGDNKIIIFDLEFVESYRKYWYSLSVRNQILDNRQRDPAELHQVCGARHSHLGVPQLQHPPGSLPGEEVQEDLCRRSLQILSTEVGAHCLK